MSYNNSLINNNKNLFPHPNSASDLQKKIKDLNARFQAGGGTYFVAGSDSFQNAAEFTKVHIDLYRDKNCRPSLPLLAEHLADCLGIDKTGADYKALLLVALRAEIGQEDPPPAYHNALHFIDVAATTAAYLQHSPGLSTHEKALTLIAAVGHDIDHGGAPNPADDPVYNEEKSFKQMEPLLSDAGLSAEDIMKIRTILLTTSINGPKDALKKVAHCYRAQQPVDASFVSGAFSALTPLVRDKNLTQMAAIVVDADIYASSGAGLKASNAMTSLFAAEMQKLGVPGTFTGDAARIGFFKYVIGEDYLSDAARLLSGPSFKALWKASEKNLSSNSSSVRSPSPK